MSNAFNLNSTDYDINELKDLLNLRDPYTLKDIVKNEDELREKLLLDNAVSTQKKKEIIEFSRREPTARISARFQSVSPVSLPSQPARSIPWPCG